jgi:two-component system, OmpR family, phosphate regulon sensor histidine kinase PhoR
MNKFLFRLLIVLMSISLVGIIIIQVYWFDNSLKNNTEQFKFHVKQVLGNVAEKLQKLEAYTFYEHYNRVKDSIGKPPVKSDFLEFGYYQINSKTNEAIIYSNNLIVEDFGISSQFFDKKKDSIANVKSFTTKRKTAIYNNGVDQSSLKKNIAPDVTITKSGRIDILENAQFEIFFKDICALKPIQERVSNKLLQSLLAKELKEYGINTSFEYNVYSNGLATKIRSEGFEYDKNSTYSIPIFTDNEGNTKYQLLIQFPCKKRFLFSELIGICILSIIFTLIIIIAYSSALNQLIKQRQISEIKTDFINNMTHEFKTPIATINLALDAIRNPKVIEDKEKVLRYLQMIKDENKRMHAQVENVLRISKLEKKELEITKENHDIHEIIDIAVDHIGLLIEDRKGTITKSLKATRTTTLVNDMHFTNVLVNILDNAIKYSPNQPIIEVITENVKDYVIIKVKDQGSGMSKTAQKRIFEKFYREHTGDIHNVKGHGLGLAYVKRIVEDHNGQISVESEKGKGSTFIIKLPVIN